MPSISHGLGILKAEDKGISFAVTNGNMASPASGAIVEKNKSRERVKGVR